METIANPCYIAEYMCSASPFLIGCLGAKLCLVDSRLFTICSYFMFVCLALIRNCIITYLIYKFQVAVI